MDNKLTEYVLKHSKSKDKELKSALERAVYQKPRAHCFDDGAQITEQHIMSQIGG